MAVQVPVSRAQADAPMVDEDPILIQSSVDAKGYRLEVWIPKESLHGFDPVQQPLLGFFCCLNDAELGRIPLAHRAEFPFESDPHARHRILFTQGSIRCPKSLHTPHAAHPGGKNQIPSGCRIV
ncbi:MAG: hypothetical protein R3C01_01970 [Planctomycetaceae bacterium]